MDEAKSVGEAQEGLMRSFSSRAERRLWEPDDLFLDLKTTGMGGMASQGLLDGVNSRSEVIESKSDCHSSRIAGRRILAANLPNFQCCT